MDGIVEDLAAGRVDAAVASEEFAALSTEEQAALLVRCVPQADSVACVAAARALPGRSVHMAMGIAPYSLETALSVLSLDNAQSTGASKDCVRRELAAYARVLEVLYALSDVSRASSPTTTEPFPRSPTMDAPLSPGAPSDLWRRLGLAECRIPASSSGQPDAAWLAERVALESDRRRIAESLLRTREPLFSLAETAVFARAVLPPICDDLLAPSEDSIFGAVSSLLAR